MNHRRLSVVVAVKRTSWRRALEGGGDPHVRELVQRGDPAVDRMRQAHLEHEASLREVEAALRDLDMVGTYVPASAPSFDAEGADLVLTVGGDGTLLTASHHVGRGPVLGINSAPSSSVGYFCAARLGSVAPALAAFRRGTLPALTLARMEVTVNGAIVSRRVLNDALFCHASPAATSRYVLSFGPTEEEQRSSGFWVGPAAGSTAAQRSAGGEVLPLTSEQLQFVVREPYTPGGGSLALTRGVVNPGERLRAVSKMGDARLFLDGPQEAHSVGLGDALEFRRSDEPLVVLGLRGG
ncbi:MAG: NAD(+)/NADH kinase [Polyangiaceae bacterium]|jgi:NAD+ kinase|nr:NAD(+)/NADH kinase [Polyangiaceae bacterium]